MRNLKNLLLKIINTKVQDKVFIIIFLFFLIIPVFNINQNVYSENENRRLAQLNKIYDFEKWLNDRFFLRENLINLNRNIIYKISLRYPHINHRVADKKTKFINRYAQSPIYAKKMSPKEYRYFVRGLRNGLESLNIFCKKNRIKLYVLILPEKESVHHPSLVINNNDKDIIKFINEIKGHVNIIFPIEELQKEVKNGNYMYYKTDHHLTNDGYYISYQKLISQIQNDYPDVKILPKTDFSVQKNILVNPGITTGFFNGSNCQNIGFSRDLCEKYLDVSYKYYYFKDGKNSKRKDIKNRNIRSSDFYYAKGSNKRVLIIGNSYIEGLCVFLPYSFKRTKKIRLNGPPGINETEQYKILKYYKKTILKFKPDMIILCIGYDTIKYLSDINKD